MKSNFRNILFIILFFTNISYSQFYVDSVISNYVIELFNIADKETKSDIEKSNGINENDTIANQIQNIARLYFKIFEEDPVGYNIYLRDKSQKWESDRNLLEVKPAIKIRRIKEKIANKYGVLFTEIIKNPAFLRCKFLSVSSSYYKNTFRCHNFSFIIEDVLKGDKYFKMGDTITVKMIPDVECPSPNFIIGRSYLIPVSTNLGLGDNSFNIIFGSLQDNYNTWIMGEPPKTFPIEDEVVLNGKYMGFAKMDWKDFKEYFKQRYLIFK